MTIFRHLQKLEAGANQNRVVGKALMGIQKAHMLAYLRNLESMREIFAGWNRFKLEQAISLKSWAPDDKHDI